MPVEPASSVRGLGAQRPPDCSQRNAFPAKDCQTGAWMCRLGPLTARLMTAAMVLAAIRAQAAPPDEVYASASEHYAAQRWQQSAEAFGDFAEAYPNDERADTARFFSGESLVQAGQFEEASRRLQELADRAPQHRFAATARFRVGECLLLAGKNAEAADKLSSFHKLHPSDPLNAYVLPYLGDIALEAKQIEQARGHYEQALRNYPAGPLSLPCRVRLARCLELLGKPAEAAKVLTAALADVKGDEDAASLHFNLARMLAEAGDTAGAEDHYQQIALRWPKSEWADDALHARLLLADLANDSTKAEALAAEFLRRHENSPLTNAVRLQVVRSLLTHQKWLAAEELLAQLTDETGATQENYYRALAKLGQKQYAEALAILEASDSKTIDHSLQAPLAAAKIAALFGLKRYDELIQPLREQITAAANESAASIVRSQLIVALTETGKIDEAWAELAQVAAADLADPTSARAALQLAERAFQAGELAIAQRAFTLLSADNVPPEMRSRGLSGLAWVQYKAEGKQASAATFERLLREYPDDPLAAEAALARGHSLAELGQHDAAIAAFQLVINRYAESPHKPAALLAAARLHDRLEQKRDAADLLKRLVNEHSEFPELDAALYELAWILSDLNQRAESDAAFRRISEELPKSQFWADATYRLAEQAAREKQADVAIELTDKLVATDCDAVIHQHALYLRGQLAAGAGQWNEVERLMQLLMTKHPDSSLHASAEYWLAEADFRRARYADAGKKLEQILTRSANEADQGGRKEAWLAIVPLRQAQCLVQERRWSEALELAQSIARQDPMSKQAGEAEYLAGRCLASLGKLDEAREAYQRAVESPANAGAETAAMAQWMIGESFFHQKRYAEAIAAYEQCEGYNFARWQAAALLQAGKCQLALGQPDQARLQFERLVTNFASSPYSEDAKIRLAAISENATAQRRNETLKKQ